MYVIETMTFRLRDGADEEAFLAADKRLQTDFAYQQPGIVRRTTARGDDGWIVVDLWQSAEAADAMTARWDADPIAAAFVSFLDEASVTVRRYETLD